MVGGSGDAEVEIGPNGLLAAAGSFEIAPDFGRGFVTLDGPSGDESVFTDLAVATGEQATGGLALRGGAQLDLLGRFRLGCRSRSATAWAATPGVDYVALPGTIEFPAGKKTVKLLVVPIADPQIELSKTIEIELAPDESFAPGLVSSITISLVDRK